MWKSAWPAIDKPYWTQLIIELQCTVEYSGFTDFINIAVRPAANPLYQFIFILGISGADIRAHNVRCRGITNRPMTAKCEWAVLLLRPSGRSGGRADGLKNKTIKTENDKCIKTLLYICT